MLAICHTFYSLQAGVRSPQDWVAAAATRGYQTLAVADVNGLFGAVHFARAAERAGIHPLIGATLAWAPDRYCLLLAASATGYRQLCRLVTARHLANPFDLADALATLGGTDDLLFLARAPALLRELAALVPLPNLYRLPSPAAPTTPATLSAPGPLPGIPVAVPDAWFLDADDRLTFVLLRRLRGLAAPDLLPGVEAAPGALLPEAAAWRQLHPNTEVAAAAALAERCHFRFEFGRVLFPQIRLPDADTPTSYLQRLCRDALPHLYRGPLATAAATRLEHELTVVCDKGFADYFLYVHEIVAFARGQGIPVEIRGSAAASIVSYLLGFTHCCPLAHDLCFERFLNPGRTDCPDIDIDVADRRRDEVIAFCYRRWGADRVAMVATVNSYRLAGALLDAARATGVAPEHYRALLRAAWGDLQQACPAPVDFVGDRLARQLDAPIAAAGARPFRRLQDLPLPDVPGRPGNDATAGPPSPLPAAALPGDLRDLLPAARRLVGLPRHLGIHCGGLLITPCQLTDVTPLARSPKGVVISHFEKDQAGAIGLLKMDILGNSALSVIQEARDWLAHEGRTLPEPGPPCDFKVRRLFAAGDTLGVYQCESPGMRQLCAALRPTDPRETAAALSLIRPGPSAAGMKDVFIRRRRGLEPVTYLHPGLARFLDRTYGVMLYQEDIMKVAEQLGGYSPGEADGLRRAVSKNRDPAALARERDRFVGERSAAAGIPPATAAAIWQQVTQFAAYSYCKAHAAVYGRLAWLTARLKAHHPRAFYTAVLNAHQSLYPKRVFVWDARRHGIPIFPPDVQHSAEGWIPVANGIRAGLTLVHGLRRDTVRQIVAQAQAAPFRTLSDLRRRVPFQAGELERLILVGACRAFGSREALLAELLATGAHPGQLSLFTPRLKALPSPLRAELWLTGVPFSAHPVERGRSGSCMAADLGRCAGRQVEMVGILDTWKPVRARGRDHGPARDMGFVTLEDASGLFELVLFPEAFARCRAVFSRLGPYRVRGTVSVKWDAPILEVDDACYLGLEAC